MEEEEEEMGGRTDRERKRRRRQEVPLLFSPLAEKEDSAAAKRSRDGGWMADRCSRRPTDRRHRSLATPTTEAANGGHGGSRMGE